MSTITISNRTRTVDKVTTDSYIVEGTGVLDVVNGGTVSGLITISGSGEVFVSSGGTVSDTTVSSGGTLNIVGGSATDTTVRNGGTVDILNGGESFFTLVSGGTVEVAFGGDEVENVVGSGGTVEVKSGGTTRGDIINSGGTEKVDSGGTALNFTVGNGGTVDILSGGVGSVTTLSGGTLEVASGASLSYLTFVTSAGGILQLDASQSFQGSIAGFGSVSGVTEEIDLGDISFGKTTKVSFQEAKDHVSGTLTVTDGTHTANLTLLGQYAAHNFGLSSDGHGGTIVTDPPSVVGSAASLVLAPPHA